MENEMKETMSEELKMAKIHSVLNFDSVHSEKDLDHRPGININPPPMDGSCDCCGNHISQLKPFGKAGDPLVGDFDGAYLVKRYRALAPYNEEAEQAYIEAEKHCTGDPYDWMVCKYGKEKGEYLYWTVQLSGTVGASWECRDCACLDAEEYHEQRRRLSVDK